MLSGKPNQFQTNNFDLIRVVTAVLVLTNHSLAHLQLPVAGWYTVVQQFQRVPMFFVMSGFLLSASFERNSNLKQYFTNRLARIYPALWMCLLISILVFSLIGGLSFMRPDTIPWLTAQGIGLIYTPGFMSKFGYGSYNGSLWTIVVELQFYCALPIIYWLYRRSSKQTLHNGFFYLLFGVSVAAAVIVHFYARSESGPYATTAKLLRYSFIPHAYIFMTGIIMQRWKIYEWKWIRGKALLWMGAFLLFSYLSPMNIGTKVIAMVMLACCTISLAYSAPGIATRLLNKRDYSYGIYLYHGMLLSVLVELELIRNVWYFILVTVVTFALSILSYHLIEQPAMSWAKRKNKARTPRKTSFTEQMEVQIVTKQKGITTAVDAV